MPANWLAWNIRAPGAGTTAYAQLWRSDSTSDAPDTWLSGATTIYPRPGCIALDICRHTRTDPLTAVGPLGASATTKRRHSHSADLRASSHAGRAST
ncbi:hypothetical protein GCM10010201_20930 [Pilimelia columellifera subsp. columellifera]|uniref:Uncharacterized protein n=1 Tax=Pilimelia columellifera subsp. columellifera TaxID=706583 RepID=A0ABP6AT00_9ACTN